DSTLLNIWLKLKERVKPYYHLPNDDYADSDFGMLRETITRAFARSKATDLLHTLRARVPQWELQSKGSPFRKTNTT
ncbi:hypothetical protein Tco_1395261, partial [Tanacetum coccineum]